jgi:hypothetical protein
MTPTSKLPENLARYTDGPVQLCEAIAGLQGVDLDIAKDKESWTIRQIIHHIVDGDDIWKNCIKIALGNTGVVFDLRWYLAITQIQWAKLWAYNDREIVPSLVLFSANRKHVVQLMQAINGSLEQTISIQLLDKQENVTLGWIIEMQSDHVSGHVEDIREIRKLHNL